jgi:hypothetical protein
MIWVKLSGLPGELWARSVLTDIGNFIGRFIYVDPKLLGAQDKTFAWILVELGFSRGLPAHIDLSWEQIHTHQRLDY